MTETIQNKYFTPSIEDIRVGYECEIQRGDDPWEGINLAGTAGVENAFVFWSMQKLRVPYLTKEQIEAEGWTEVKEGGIICPGINFLTLPLEKNNRWVFLPTGGNKIYITKYRGEHCIFDGECKDINTFRYICKLLNIC